VRLLSRLGDFVDERTGHRALLAHALDEPVRGGARWAYVLGSALLGTFLVQVVTGIALMTSYAPSEKTAWASVHYITFIQSGGWLVRGLHHFGAQAMVVVLAAHLAQVALFGAYKKPREMTWWLGLALFAMTLGFALTGYLLPWDQKGYWATRVATNIAGTVPVVGDAAQKMMQGGAEYGSLTLTRFYALHVAVLPALLVLIATAHVALFRKHGVTPSARADLKRVDAFFPKQLLKDTIAVLAVVAVIFVLASKEHGAPLDAPADPASNYPARPEWYFLALFQLLKYFHGPLEVVGTIVLPAVLGAYLFALPLLDRKPGTALRGRAVPLVPLTLMAAGAVGLTLQAQREDAGDAAFQKERIKADERATIANRIAKQGVPPEGPLAMMKRDPDLRGPELFDKHCTACHTLGAHGADEDRTAAKLDGWGTEAWALAMIHEPDGDARFGRSIYRGEMQSVDVPGPDSPKTFTPMAAGDKAAVAAFLASNGEKTPPRDPAKVARGKTIVTERCTTCHLFEGKGDDSDEGLAPELSGWGSAAWIRAQIENPATKTTYREHALDPTARSRGHMPRFDGAIHGDDIDLLASWVHAQTHKP
jgi:ubiquinol-cytochrome c reductase cytochrome b subunit